MARRCTSDVDDKPVNKLSKFKPGLVEAAGIEPVGAQ